MGNWRTVNITGTMRPEDALALCRLLDTAGTFGTGHEVWDAPYACLSFDTLRPGLCGIGRWPAARTDAAGNLAERDFTVEDVADALRALVHVAPSMLLKVHCGGDWESDECVATISVGEGLVVVGKPEQAKVMGPSVEQVHGNLLRNLLR